jgi:hypothetical protein
MKNLSFWRSRSGIGLMEIVVVMGLMGGMSVGIMRMMHNAQRNQMAIEQKDEAAQAAGLIRSAMTDDEICTANFKTLNPDAINVVAGLTKADGVTPLPLSIGNDPRRLSLVRYEFGMHSVKAEDDGFKKLVDTGTAGEGTAPLKIIFERAVSDTQKVQFHKIIKMVIRWNPAAPYAVTYCASALDANVGDMWQQSNVNPHLGIFYGNGRVIVGQKDDLGHEALIVRKGTLDEGLVAIGNNNTRAQGVDAFAVGNGALASGLHSMALGQSALAAGVSSMALGEDATATNNNSVAIGSNSRATANGSVAIGLSSFAPNNSGVAVGQSAQSDNSGVAIGISSRVSANSGVAVGDSSNAAREAVALGHSANASGQDSIAIGTSAAAASMESCALGKNAASWGNGTFMSKFDGGYQLCFGNGGAQECMWFYNGSGGWRYTIGGGFQYNTTTMNANINLLLAQNLNARIATLEGWNINARLNNLEALNISARLTNLEATVVNLQNQITNMKTYLNGGAGAHCGVVTNAGGSCTVP